MKPLQPTKLKKGQALGAAEGFADTYNWVVDATDNLHGDGTYITVNKSIPESPEIQLDIDALADILDGISGGCSCEMSAYYNTGYKLATFDNGRAQTDIYAPDISGAVASAVISSLSDSCSCDLSAVLTSGTLIARWTKDGQNWTDIYCLSSGSGTTSSTTLLGNVGGSTKIDGDIEITNYLSSCISAWTGVVNGTPTLSIGAFYI